jgi:asparagine synthase (glutamine-hydrolysing)
MCGIAGFAGAGTCQDVRLMSQALVHRGPDGFGYHMDEKNRVYLGHRRLAILDAEGGFQPMWNSADDIAVIFNGEIYNHEDLRHELERKGHRFASGHSDTEVLIHGYEQWGEDLPLRLNGMFAFAIYDRRKRQIFCARDRFGEKPFYYHATPTLFAFASELSALVRHSGVGRDLDPWSLKKYFAYGYIPAPRSLYAGAAKLPAGHWLRYDLASGRHTTRAYWRFALEPDHGLGDADEPRLVEELAALIAQAARRRLMSDVPLGVFLSGGLDSSCVLGALSASCATGGLQTFTIGFTERSFDESAYARIVAGHFGSRHHERILDLNTAKELIPSVLDRLDEPLGDASILPTYLLCRFAREHVTVALSGDGGDELFAGYDPFLALKPAATYSRHTPRLAHESFRWLAEFLPRSRRNMGFDFKLRRTLMGLSYPERIRLPTWMAPVEPRDVAALFDEPVRPEDLYDEAIALWEEGTARTPVDRALEFFTRFYLQDDILTKVDRAAMMVSLETRAVFLDNDLVQFCRRLPADFKFRNGERKYLLKRVAERMLPKTIAARRKKGFGIPLAEWLKSIPASPPLEPIPGVRGEWAEEAWKAHRRGAKDHRLFLWSWLSLQHAVRGRREEEQHELVA